MMRFHSRSFIPFCQCTVRIDRLFICSNCLNRTNCRTGKCTYATEHQTICRTINGSLLSASDITADCAANCTCRDARNNRKGSATSCNRYCDSCDCRNDSDCRFSPIGKRPTAFRIKTVYRIVFAVRITCLLYTSRCV